VGEKVAVPKLATPEMFTAGPTVSLTGAAKRPSVYWMRVSLMVRDETVATLLAVIVWSRLFSAVPRLTAFNPPTF
jgi:hypothetical protein